MKYTLLTFLFTIFFGLQLAKADILNLGTAEALILVMISFFVFLILVGFIFLCLYLIKRTKFPKHD